MAAPVPLRSAAPRSSADFAQLPTEAAHPRAVEARLLPLPPGLDVWLLVEEWCVGAPPDPADAAHQAALQEAKRGPTRTLPA